MGNLIVGSIVSAKVVEVASYGVKIVSDDEAGFIQIPELSWDVFDLQNRVTSICKVGDIINVKILSITEDQFYASRREVDPELNPWNKSNIPYIGQKFKAEIVLITDYGYIVKMSNSMITVLPYKKCDYTFKLGKKIDVIVDDINVNKQKIFVKLS